MQQETMARKGSYSVRWDGGFILSLYQQGRRERIGIQALNSATRESAKQAAQAWLARDWTDGGAS